MSTSIDSFAGEASQESFDLLLRILNHIPDPISVKNDCLQFILANDALCARKGTPQDKLLGKTLLDLPEEDRMELIWQHEHSVLKTGETHIAEETLVGSEGNTSTCTTRIERIADKSGRYYIFTITKDITQNQNGGTQSSDTTSGKSHPAPPRAVIHDLNNLLNVVTGYTELLLEDTDANDPKRKDLETILQASDRAVSLTSKF